jgi:hypothetical protein
VARLLLVVALVALCAGAGPALGLHLSGWATAGLVLLGIVLLLTGLI